MLANYTSNLTDELSKQAKSRSGIAIYLPQRALDFQQLEILTWRTATFMRQNGVKTGDVVAHTFANELTLLISMLATARIGATVFSIPRSSPSILRADMAAAANAQILVTDCLEGNDTGLPHLVINIESLSKASAPIDISVRVESPQAPWLLITGSGSTGRPKMMPVTHAQFRARMALYDCSISISPKDRVASLIHLDFASSKHQYLNALFSGASIVLFDRTKLNPIELCRRYPISVLYTVVLQIEQMLSSLPKGAKNILGSLRALVTGGSMVSDVLRQRVLEMLSQNLYVRYGTNEAGPISVATPVDIMNVERTIGRPLSGVLVEVVDMNGHTLPFGEIGLIRVKSAGIIDGYLDEEETNRCTFKDGWFLPRDLGKLNSEGHLIYCGRADNMMIMNGINIYPAEIERVISNHPAIREAIAIPLRSHVHQDIPVCVVTLHEGAQVSENEMLDFAFQRLGSHGPKRIIVLDQIPHNAMGKLMRSDLLHEVASKLGIKQNTQA